MARTYVKLVKPNSFLARNPTWANRALEALAAAKKRIVLSPGHLGSCYFPLIDGGRGYVTDFLQEPQTLWESCASSAVPHVMVDVGLLASLDMFEAGTTLRAESADVAHDLGTIQDQARSLWASETAFPQAGRQLREEVLKLLTSHEISDAACDFLSHADLHPGNVILSGGRLHVVDLENMRPAPAFTDMLYVATWCRYAHSPWSEALTLLSKRVRRAPSSDDFVAAISIMTIQASLSGGNTAERLLGGISWLLGQKSRFPN